MSLYHNPGPEELNLRFENQRLREELSRIKEELSKAKIRAGQLAVEVMRKSAELSKVEEILKRWQTELEIAAGQKGHNLCWADFPRVLKRTIGHTGRYPDPDNTNPEEFAYGCVAYHGDTFGECGVRLVVVKEEKK